MDPKNSIQFTRVNKKNKDALFNLASSQLIDYELASLKLQLLKENFEYRQFYEHFRKSPKSFLSLSPTTNGFLMDANVQKRCSILKYGNLGASV